jgi:hypothetical protein
MKQPKRDRTTKAAKTNKTMYPIPQRLGMAKKLSSVIQKKKLLSELAGRE